MAWENAGWRAVCAGLNKLYKCLVEKISHNHGGEMSYCMTFGFPATMHSLSQLTLSKAMNSRHENTPQKVHSCKRRKLSTYFFEPHKKKNVIKLSHPPRCQCEQTEQ